MQSDFAKLRRELSAKESQRKAIREHKCVAEVDKCMAAQPLAPDGKFI
jgi:hypothetical protein